MKSVQIFLIVLLCVGVVVGLVFLTISLLKKNNSSDDNGGGGGGGGGGGSSGGNVDIAVVKPKLIDGEKQRIKDNFSSIKAYLPLLDDPTDNQYTITSVATCVGTNLAKRVVKGELDADKLLEQMKSPDLSDPNYIAIIQEETNCNYNKLLEQAEHMAMYTHCVSDGPCTEKDLINFFKCFIGDGSAENVDYCKSATNSLCPGNCEPQDLVLRKLRTKRRAELAVVAAHMGL